jgi:hypothetical protein
MEDVGAAPPMTDEVCDIIGHHHHPRQDETLNFKVLYDADLIANIEDSAKKKEPTKEHLEKLIEKNFLTKTGRQRARDLFLK